jgi:serine/threonine protein kinase
MGEPALVRVTSLEIARGTVLAGRYQVEAVIGKGGSGIVLRAFDRVTQLAVAVKLLKPELAADPRWIERFSRELRLARQIQHPNVCRVFDIGQADGHWFITMELATAGTLRDSFERNDNARTVDQRLEDIRAVLAGLGAIHAAGIVHRDVKPDNFLRMADGRLVLSDFGLATNPSDASVVSILVGTPSYMAPEVVLGEQASFSSDIWSLGVVMHEILFGRRPEWTQGKYRRAVPISKRATDPRERAITFLIEECVHYDIADRPRDAREALTRRDDLLSSKARRPLGRARASRRRWGVPALVATAALAAALVGGRLWRHASAGSEIAWQRSPKIANVTGSAADWTRTINVVASLHDHVHCMSWSVPDHVLQLVVGTPRRALDLDVRSGSQRPATLPEGTFAVGCPQRSPMGALLFERLDGNGRHEIALVPESEDARTAKTLTAGSEPVWLPSGNEFVYTADDTHAAIFSVPVMTTNIISESPTDGGLLVDKAVGRDGRSVALRYFDNALRRHVVIHDLPSLAVVRSVILDGTVADLDFGSKNNALWFSIDGAAGNVLATLPLDSPSAVRLGGVPGRNVTMPRWGLDRLAVVSSAFESDVWTVENGKRGDRLTTDGESYYPDLSRNGDLLVEHLNRDGKLSVQLARAGSALRPVTTGPRDLTPRFLPDGTEFLYVDGQRQAIRKCGLTGSCRDVLVTSDVPFFPVASPDQRTIAYVTVVGRNRLKTVDETGTVHDLGPARPDCPPHWASDSRIWVLQGTDQSPMWAERDAATGHPLTTVRVTESPRRDTKDCPFLSASPGARDARRASTWTREEADIGVISDQQPGVGTGQNP